MATATKTNKAVKTARVARITRDQVISFRITVKQYRLLQEIYERDRASNVNSENQLCRKWVCDMLAGRLDYRNPEHKLSDMDTVGA